MGISIADIVGGGLGTLVKDVVGTFKLDPAKKAEFQAAIDENAAQLALKQLELQEKMQASLDIEVQTASANIRAETGSADRFTSRARPMFMYVVEFILLWNYVVVPIFKQTPVTLPEALFWLFGSMVLGYTGARSWDKYAEKFMGSK